MADIQKTLGYWSKNNKPFAADVIKAFKRYLYYGVFASRSFRTRGQKKFYDFDYQHACLSFAGAMNDAGFECLALAEVRYAWVGSKTALGITRSRKLFGLAPTTDNLLDAMRKVALGKPGSKLHKDYLFSCNVLYTAEWKALDQRLQGLDSPSPLAVEFRSGTINSSNAAKFPRSISATALSKLIEDAKQETAGKAETEVQQE